MDTFNVIVGLLGAFGTFVGVASFIYARRVIRMSCKIRKSDLLGGSKNALPGEVTIVFDGKKISNLRKINCIFWNSGNIEIKRDLLPSKNPISILFSDQVQILKASVLKNSIPENEGRIVPDNSVNNKFYIDFEFLNPKQGLNVEILYSGIITAPTLKGIIIGAKKPVDIVISDYKFNRFNDKISIAVSITIVISFLALFFFIDNFYSLSMLSASPFYVVPLIIVFTVVMMTVSAVISDLLSKFITKYRVSPSDVE